MLYIGSIENNLKEYLFHEFDRLNIEYEEIKHQDIYDLTCEIVNKVLENKDYNKGIIIDQYGVIPFMIASKHKYIICAELNDEHSAKMTRDHNNTNIITLGSKVVGDDIALSIALRFIYGKYAGGRHQIRIDMLDKMG